MMMIINNKNGRNWNVGAGEAKVSTEYGVRGVY